MVILNLKRMVLGSIKLKGILPITILIFFFINCLYAKEKPNTSNLKKTAELKANNNIASPKDFLIDYKLNKITTKTNKRLGIKKAGKSSNTKTNNIYAEVAVNILGANFKPIKTYVLRNVQSTENAVTLWDGRDSYGREMPKGEYYVQLSIVYSDKTKETKCYRFNKE